MLWLTKMISEPIKESEMKKPNCPVFGQVRASPAWEQKNKRNLLFDRVCISNGFQLVQLVQLSWIYFDRSEHFHLLI